MVTPEYLERRIVSIERQAIDSRLYYCKISDCPNCNHPTIQSSLRLQGENEDAYQCLVCGKIYHKEQKLVEYKG